MIVPKGRTVFKEGDKDIDKLYFVIAGTLSMHADVESNKVLQSNNLIANSLF